MKNRFSPLTSLLLVVFLLFPFLFLIIHIDKFSFSAAFADGDEFFWALKNSVLQASGSALLAFLLALVFSSGLFFLKSILNRKSYEICETLCLLPGVLPSLLTILIAVSLINPFPIGLRGIILIHGFIYSGFLAVTWVHFIEEKAATLIEVAYVLGASRWQILVSLVGLLKVEILSLLILVFSICFTSFAIPIAVGGGHGTTLEILIYEKIRLSGAYDQALALSLLQSGFLFLFSFLQKPGALKTGSRNVIIPKLGTWLGAICLLGSLGLIIYTFAQFSFRGWRQVFQLQGLLDSVLAAAPITFFIGLMAGFGVYALLMLSAFGMVNGIGKSSLRRFINGYVAPSTTLAGLVVILLNPSDFGLQILLYIAAFCTLVTASIYRMGFDQQLMSLQKQIEVGQILGGDELQIFAKIIFPQVHFFAARLAGIAALWMVGDFALAKIIFSQDVTEAQIVEGLLNSYHFEPAMALMSVVIAIGIMLYFLFMGFGRVLSQKS